MAKQSFDVNTTTKILETTKQFVGGLKTVDTDDSLGSFFLRDAENISLSEYGFIEKRYGLIDNGDFDDSLIVQLLTHPHQNYKVQGYFEYVRKDGFIDQIVFINGRLFLSRPNDGVTDTPETSDGKFRQVKTFHTVADGLYISDALFNDYVQRFVLDPIQYPNQTTSQTRSNFDDLFLGVEEIEGVRHNDVLYIFTGVYPIVYKGDGKFYLLEEFVPTFTELKIFSHNIHNADNARYYSEITASQTIENSKFLRTSDENVVFEFLDEVAYPRLPFTKKEGTIFTVELAYTLHPNLLPGLPFVSFIEGAAIRPESQGGKFVELIPRVYYRPSGIGASELEWREISKDDLKYTRRTNFDESNYNVNTFKTYSVDNPPVFSDFPGGVDFFKFDWQFESTRAINQPITSEDPYKVEIQNMPIGTYDIRVDLVLQTAGYEAVGANDLKFVRSVVKTIPRVYPDITFTEEQLTDYLDIDPAGLWTCNRVLNHYGKLMVYGSRITPQRVFIGHPTYTEFFPDFFTIDFETDDEQEIQKITPFMNILIVQSESFTWGLKGIDALIGSENPYQQFSVSPIYGTIAPKSVRPVRNQLFFLSRDGLVTLQSLYAIDDQYNVKRIDKNIENIIPQDPDAVAIQYDNQYWIHFPNTNNNMTLRYYIDTKSWVKDTYFEWDGLNQNGEPNPSAISFNGVSKYIRQDGDLYFITNLFQPGAQQNLTFKKVKIEDSIPTDLLEVPKTMFETAYMNQGYPFHPKKYMENRYDFTIQNEFNFASNGEVFQIENQNSQLVGGAQVLQINNIPDLNPNHTYRVEVVPQNPQGYDSSVPYTLSNVALRKNGVVIGEQIATPQITTNPVLFEDDSIENIIRFKLINNDEQPVDLAYGVDLDINIRNDINQYPNKIFNVGSRNITETIELVVENAAQGSTHTLYFLAKSADKLQSATLSEAYVLSGSSGAPVLEPVLSSAITQTSIRVHWADTNLDNDDDPASTQFRVGLRNQTTSLTLPVVTDDASEFLFSGVRYFYDFENLTAGNLYLLSVAAFYNGVWSNFATVTVATVPGLISPQITSITGTRTIQVNWTDGNLPPENETLQLLQFGTTNILLTENTPTPIEIPADVVTRQVILDDSNVRYQFRMRAVNEDTNEQSLYGFIHQYVHAVTPVLPTLFNRDQTSISINYEPYTTATVYETSYKLSSSETWEDYSFTLNQMTAASFRQTFAGLDPNTSYDFRYRVLFPLQIGATQSDVYTPYGISTITTLAPFDLTATPTVTTVSTTYNSITLRILNNEPGSITVYADLGTSEPSTLRGVIQNQNGTLDITFDNLPDELTEYDIAVQVRILNESKLRSNLLIYSEFTSDFPEIGIPSNWRTISDTGTTQEGGFRDWIVGWGAPTGAGSEFFAGYNIQQFRWYEDETRPTVTTESPGVSGLTQSTQASGSIAYNPEFTRDEIRVRAVNQFGKKSAYTSFRIFRN